MLTYLSLHGPNPLVQPQPHHHHKTDPLCRLVVVEVWLNPVKTSHLHQAQENRIVQLIFGAKLDTFIRSNNKPP